METWRLLNLEYPDPYRNMAVEEAILLAVERGWAPNTLRFWRNRNAVVMGHFQSVASDVNVSACIEYDTAIVRRFTGGGAVYHDLGNLNWTLAVNRIHPLIPATSLEFFRVFGQVITMGLSNIGVEAEFCPPNSILVNGGKVSGLAACVKRAAFLCHGTLLIGTDLIVLSRVLKVPKQSSKFIDEKRSVKSKPSEVTSLDQESRRQLDLSVVKEELVKSFEKALDIKLKNMPLTEEELILVKSLWAERYGRVEWNLGR
ncbi:MAG: hypothetical protein GTN80_04770 [Nitrososphaeria archaeon]|nr:hypothetical protein [Nitrososphaeria archaeon]NIN52440.1 hypothetical protein [Nitrososphaeria archaeon]NIQ32941.1 hypothetical protein [Nitrososphaeria archaeon]